MEDLSILAVKDSDPFNRWSAANKLMAISLIKDYQSRTEGSTASNSKEGNELNPFVFDAMKRILQRFVPETTKREWKLEQDANKRKQMMRNRRREEKEKMEEQQFLLQNNAIFVDEEEAYQRAQDLSDEQFIDDLIGEKAKGSTESAQKLLARNPLLASRLLKVPSFNYLFELLADADDQVFMVIDS